MNRRTLLIAAVLALAACGGDDSDSAAETTTTEATTTTVQLTGRAAFDAELADQLTGYDAAGLAAIGEAAEGMCGILTIETDEIDPSQRSSLDDPTIGALATRFRPPVARVVLTSAGDHLCPDAKILIDRWMDANL